MTRLQVAYKFKLQPTSEQSQKLEDWQHLVGYVQNRSLGDRTSTYSIFTKKSKYPNFKKHKDVSFEYPPGASINIVGNHISFPGLGTMRFFKSRSIPESWEIRTVTVRPDADGWYVSVLLRDQTLPELPIKTLEECETIQGCDVGIKKLVALSDGTIINNPRFHQKAERRLAIRQRRVSRKQKGSKNREKAAKRLARTHLHVRRQREDYQWKTGKRIAANADISTFEDLNVKGMIARCKPKTDPTTGKYVKNGQAAKAGLNRAIADAAWYSLRQKTEHQAKKMGNLVITVDPKYTSLECPECHHISSGNRDKEKFICTECDYAQDADVNGAKNQANRGKTNLGKDTLRVVSPKVTPTEISLTLVGEPGNPAKPSVNQRQLRLVTVKSIVATPKPNALAAVSTRF